MPSKSVVLFLCSQSFTPLRFLLTPRPKSKSPPNVLPLVNKGLALYQWKQDISAAERCCHEALRIDNECEAAVATLAQLSLQQSKIPEASKVQTSMLSCVYCEC